jgi:adenosylhomocysteine nucleosidase
MKDWLRSAGDWIMDNTYAIVVIISANAEWQAVIDYYQPDVRDKSPYGEFFLTIIKHQPVAFLQGGWGKISAAAATQYAIDHWNPELIINLGTCGGFVGTIQRGQILLPQKIVVYDIIEQMSNPQEAIDFYSTDMDNSWLKQPYPIPVESGVLASADRDIMPGDIPSLIQTYQARAADWESGAITWVAIKKHNRRCLILRGVSDLVSEQGGEAYENNYFYKKSAERIMQRLCDSLPGWLVCAGY